MEETGCENICGAPTTLAVQGQMMMMNARDITIGGALKCACTKFASNKIVRGLFCMRGVILACLWLGWGVANCVGHIYSRVKSAYANFTPEFTWRGRVLYSYYTGSP